MNILYKIALLGNPNCGKSSIFNLLTGLNQKVGNFPGVTVDKKSGLIFTLENEPIQVIDLPGTYSLFPNAEDEKVVTEILTNPKSPDYPDLILYVADCSNLEKHLLLFTQAADLGIPLALLLNMSDVASQKGVTIDTKELRQNLGVPVFLMNGRNAEGISDLIVFLRDYMKTGQKTSSATQFYSYTAEIDQMYQDINLKFGLRSNYLAKLWLHHYSWLQHLSPEAKSEIEEKAQAIGFQNVPLQISDTLNRFDQLGPILKKSISQTDTNKPSLTRRLDKVFSHPIIGPGIFFLIMFLLFQAIFTWSDIPMTWIEEGFVSISGFLQNTLPSGWATDLLTEGIIAGLGGILVFVPQIAILFLLIGLLEESGYMARAVYLFDGFMQRFGMNGRSVVALISGGACAIPAIMSTRTISNWKERMTTIMVTPLISCAARIPIYTVLIGLLIPQDSKWGPFGMQGIVFMGLYLTGILAALGLAWLMKLILKSKESSTLLMPLPDYKAPVMRNVLLTVKEKVSTFVTEAGKIILVISIILWFLASYAPGNRMEIASDQAKETALAEGLDEEASQSLEASYKLETSYAGIFGKTIEPVIKPLGFDWKIGISLLTSFAAREVFVGTMSTIYSVGSENEDSVREKLENARDPDTGQKVYTFATTLSLLIFYIFAMQCMSTFAIVRRETKSLKWPLIQFGLFTLIAYLGSYLTYSILS